MSRARPSKPVKRPPPAALKAPGGARAVAPARADATRERLMAATHELLVERAGADVSVGDICARAGVNVAMVKYCFGSKDGLLQELLDRITAGFAQDVSRLDEQELDAEEKLRLHVAAIVNGYVRYPYLNRLINTQLLASDAKVVKRLSRHYAQPMRAWHERMLSEGARDGTLRKVDPTFFFFTVIGMAEFFFTAQPIMRQAFAGRDLDESTVTRFIDHTVEVLLHGIGRRAS